MYLFLHLYLHLYVFLSVYLNSQTRRAINMDAEADGVPPTAPAAAAAAANSDLDLAARRRLFISQPSTLASRRQQAVCVRRAHKMYGGGKNPNIVLDGLNMTVPKGSM